MKKLSKKTTKQAKLISLYVGENFSICGDRC